MVTPRKEQGSRILAILSLMLLLDSLSVLAFSPSVLSTERRSSAMSAGSKGSKPKYQNKSKRSSKRRSTPNAKKLDRGPPRQPSGPRPVIADYDENRNTFVNRRRLQDSIGCEHFGLCPGCVVDNQVGQVDIVQSAKLYFASTSVRKNRRDVIEQGLEWSTEEKDDGFYKVVIPSDVTQWRTQAKLAVAPKSSSWAKDGCQFGLFQRGSHKVLSIPECAVHHPSINLAVHALVKATDTCGTPGFQESSREGGLRYVQFQVERLTRKVSLTLVWNAETLKETQPHFSRLAKELNKLEPDLWHSVWCHCNDSVGNNIFARSSRRWHRMSGPEFMREPLPVGDQGWLYFSPLAFRQGNIDGFDVLATDVAKAVPGGSKVCELYAGVGMLGLTALAHHFGEGNPLVWIRCSDENPANPACFQRAVDSLPLEMSGRGNERRNGRKQDQDDGLTLAELAAMVESGETIQEERKEEKTSYMVASAAKALRAGQALGAQVLIVDPPRKGLEREVVEELRKPFNPDQPYVENASVLTMPDEQVNWANDVQTLIYVSCGFDALARDCQQILSGQGGWVLDEATGYVLFPGSDHVETLAIFRRK